jgi:hypothetical protein
MSDAPQRAEVKPRGASGVAAVSQREERDRVLIGRLVYSTIFDSDPRDAARRVTRMLRTSGFDYDRPQEVMRLIDKALSYSESLTSLALDMQSDQFIRTYLSCVREGLEGTFAEDGRDF